MTKAYAGIGSRKTPEPILQVMSKLAARLYRDGWELRSGGAAGADSAFWRGCNGVGRVYRPEDATAEAIELASQFHPAWDRCSDYVRKLHGRNAMILLGDDLQSPASMVVCWTPEGKDVGGTGLGIRIARDRGIPVRNLADTEVLGRCLEWLGERYG